MSHAPKWFVLCPDTSLTHVWWWGSSVWPPSAGVNIYIHTPQVRMYTVHTYVHTPITNQPDHHTCPTCPLHNPTCKGGEGEASGATGNDIALWATYCHPGSFHSCGATFAAISSQRLRVFGRDFVCDIALKAPVAAIQTASCTETGIMSQ